MALKGKLRIISSLLCSVIFTADVALLDTLLDTLHVEHAAPHGSPGGPPGAAHNT